MARPLAKMNKERLKYLIDNPQRLAWAAIARKFEVDHTTILYWVRKLRREGFVLNEPDHQKGGVEQLLDELKKEYRSKNKQT